MAPSPEDILGAYEAAVLADPKDAESWFKLGIACRNAGNLNAALTCFRAIMELHPENIAAYVEHGIVLRKQGNLEGARTSYMKALELEPDSVETHFNLGNLCREEGRFEDACACYERALLLRPDFAPACNNLGLLHEEQGRLDEALTEYRRAVAIKPDFAGAYVNIGNVLKAQNRLPDAIASYRAAIQATPNFAEAHHSLGLALLAAGNFEEGWSEFEWRLRCRETGTRIGARVFPRPLWDGETIKGKTILIYTEQGLGDAIQFSRYLALVKERGARIIFGTYPDLLRLFAELPGVDLLVDITAPTLPLFDTYCALMSLPRIFKTTQDSIPREIPYVRPDLALTAQWSERMPGSTVNVGLVWASNTQNRIGRLKSLPWSHLHHLTETQGVTFFSFQKGEPGREATSPCGPANIRDVAGELTDFAQTAGAIANLDLLISIDTSVAHLAGAMGKPVWTLLPFAPDWRWLMDREDTPWYPSMRLFRQPSPGEWGGVIENVRKQLAAFVVAAQEGGRNGRR